MVKTRFYSIFDHFIHPFTRSNIITLYLCLKPIYLFPSGLPQISDMLLMLYVLYIIITKRGIIHFPSKANSIILLLIGLFWYQLLINLIWSTITTYDLFINCLFYLFNTIAFIVCCYICYEFNVDQVKQSILNGCLVSCLISIIGLYIGDQSVRAIGFFNNPNQLGYHGLLLVSFVFLCAKERFEMKSLLIIVGSFWLIISSASKAALLGSFFLVISYYIFTKESKGKKNRIFSVFIVLIVFVVIYLLLYSDNYWISSNRQISFMRNRLFTMQTENDSDLGSGRGYNRIGEMGINLLWGMGEGGYERFSVMRGAEIHSTYASFIVSYGLIGITWLIFFFVLIVRSNSFIESLRKAMILSGLLLYGISHNGIRNTLLWIFFAVVLSNDNHNEISKNKKCI